MTPLDRLRARARCWTLFPPTTLAAAIDRLGFVQADPIRAPARAQDLTLRHRVAAYRVGDLERRFARLRLEEDFLHAHGIMPQANWALLHPRTDRAAADGRYVPAGLAADVLEAVRRRGRVHPGDLSAQFGRDVALNAWGVQSRATTHALDALRHHGLLRIVGRQRGIRLYAPRAPAVSDLSPDERARRAILIVARLLAPISPVSLRGALALMARKNPDLGPLGPAMHALIRSGALEREEIDGETYLWPPPPPGDVAIRRDVRLLSPFDPLVWDRRRFEHLWGWPYRFEAYTPAPRRRLGYYAMPLLWAESVIGWANVSVTGGKLTAALGFARHRPRERAFERALEAELARLQRFLHAQD